MSVFQIFLYGALFVFSLLVTSRVGSVRLRNALLVAVSYALYLSWNPWFFAVLLLSTLGNYGFGLSLRKKESRAVLLTGIAFNLALLGSFKYIPPVAAGLPLASLHRLADLALPLGISFWTFQALSYLLDLYRGEELDPSLIEFALYMAFFPVAISGPICRMPDMLPQFREHSCARWAEIGAGLRRVAIGVLMMLVARLLGQGILSGDGITSGFDSVTHWGGTDVWLLAFGFGLQLFFDFAGYSHIAIGAAQALGFTVPENFDRPFSSATPSVFWTRWHISLSFWIRDYVFLPLAVLRREIWWRNLMLVVAMVSFGLWHKATILFVIWGCYHGILLVLHRLVQQAQYKFDWNPPEHLWTPLSWLATISLVSLGWIFFRANSLGQASAMFTAVLSPSSYLSRSVSGSLYGLVTVLAAGYTLVRLASDALDRHAEQACGRKTVLAKIADHRWYWITPLYALALLFVLMITMTQGGGVGQFMYRGF